MTEDQLARMRAYGEPQLAEAGTELFRAGDLGFDFVLVDSGVVDIVRAATSDAAEETVTSARRGPLHWRTEPPHRPNRLPDGACGGGGQPGPDLPAPVP